MKRKIDLFIFGLQALFHGFKVGLEWWHLVVFKGKVPYVVIIPIILLFVPINIGYLIMTLICNQWKHIEEMAEGVAQEVEEAKQN